MYCCKDVEFWTPLTLYSSTAVTLSEILVYRDTNTGADSCDLSYLQESLLCVKYNDCCTKYLLVLSVGVLIYSSIRHIG